MIYRGREDELAAVSVIIETVSATLFFPESCLEADHRGSVAESRSGPDSRVSLRFAPEGSGATGITALAADAANAAANRTNFRISCLRYHDYMANYK